MAIRDQIARVLGLTPAPVAASRAEAPVPIAAATGWGASIPALMGSDGGPLGRESALTLAEQGWAAIARHLNAQRVAEIDFYVADVRGRGRQEEWKRNDAHPVSYLLWRPTISWGGGESAAEQRYRLALHLQEGDAFLLRLTRPGSRETTGLQVLDPWRMERVLDSTGARLIGWNYRAPTGKLVPMLPEDVIHIKRPASTEPVFGSGVAQQQAAALRTQQQIDAYGRAIVQSGGRLGHAIVTDMSDGDGKPDPGMVARIGNIVRAALNQAKRGDGIVTLPAGVDLKPIATNPKDLEFLQLDDRTRDRILAAYGVPGDLVGLSKDSNRATAIVAERTWISNTIEPLAQRIADALSQALLPQPDRTAVTWQEVRFDDPTPGDPEADAKVAEIEAKKDATLISGSVLTPNEARAARGLPPLPGGDVLLTADGRPLTAVAAEAELAATPPSEPAGGRSMASGDPDPDPEPDGPPGGPRSRSEGDDAPAPDTEEQARDAYWHQWDREVSGPGLRKIRAIQARIAREQEAEVMAALEAQAGAIEAEYEGRYPDAIARRNERWEQTGDARAISSLIAKILPSLNAWSRRLGALAQPVLVAIIKRAGKAELSELGLSLAFDVERPAVTKWARERAFTHYAGNVQQTTIDNLRRELSQGLKAGESVNALASRIRKTYGQMGKARAVMAARTESTAAANFGTQTAQEDAVAQGVKIEKEWIATADSRTRDTHRAVGGQRVPVKGKFTVGGSQCDHPGDPALPARESVNCRCTMRSRRIT